MSQPTPTKPEPFKQAAATLNHTWAEWPDLTDEERRKNLQQIIDQLNQLQLDLSERELGRV